jgi:hypothetical protein
MLGSALVLSLGLAILAAVRVSGAAVSYGFAVFIGILVVAAACAIHLGAISDRVLTRASGVPRFAVRVVAWLAVGAGTAWVIGRAPGDEVVFSLLTVPTGLGIAGLAVARRDPWPALPFLVVAGLFVALLGPLWVARH